MSEMYRQTTCCFDDHPIEECPFASDYFDLVILINVLDHVYDAEICLNKAMEITKPGGIFIIGQDLSNEEDRLTRLKGNTDPDGDIGHPIKMDHNWLDEFINKKFDSIFYKILPRDLGRNPGVHYGTYLFAGKKRN